MLARVLFVKRKLGKAVVLFLNHVDNLGIIAYYFGMATGDEQFASKEEALRTSMQAGSVFLPNTAISARELFSGRLEQITMLIDAINQVGLHAVVFGERGIGKTSLANIVKPFLSILDDEFTPKKNRIVIKINSHASDTFSDGWRRALGELSVPLPQIGFKPNGGDRTTLADVYFQDSEIDIGGVHRLLSDLGESVFVFDEFDRLPQDEAKSFTDLIKTLSDFAVAATIVLVGVADTVDALVADHQSIPRSIVEIAMPRMNPEELRAILTKGEEGLGMRFEDAAATFIVKMSQGLPHYTHLIGQHAARAACNRLSRVISYDDVSISLREAVSRAQQSIIAQFSQATRSAHKDALYSHVLLACAFTASRSIDDLGFFQPARVVEPLKSILPDRDIQIATFSNHLRDFCEENRGPVLERTGQQRNYRYRFINPLMPSFVILSGLSSGLIDADTASSLVKTGRQDRRVSNEQLPLF